MLDLRISSDPSIFWDLADEWLELLKRQPDKTPFITPHWLGIAYDFFASDEELSLITLRDSSGVLQGVLPLVKRVRGECVVVEFPFAAGYGYYDFVITPKYRNEAIEEAFRLVRGASDFRAELGPFHAQSPTLWALQKAAQNLNLNFEKVEVGSFAYIDLPDSMDELIFSMRPHDRRKFTKLVKRAHRLANMQIKSVDRPELIDEGIDSLVRIMRLLGKEIEPGHEAFLREIARILSQYGWLSIRCLDADGWRVAVALLTRYGDTVHILVEDIDPNAADVQPGVVLLVNIIEDAISMGIKRIEILDRIEGLKVGYKEQKLVKAVLSN